MDRKVNLERVATALGLCALVVAVGCSGTDKPKDKEKLNTTQLGPKVSGPRDGVFLRASFDDDPTIFVGRFVSDAVQDVDLDENRGVKTECSKFITYREVRASGTFDEYYNSSSSVKAGLGIDPSAGVPGGKVAGAAGVSGPKGSANMSNTQGTEVRVQYKLTKKIVADISDPKAFNTCCQSAADNCSGRYVGEFWRGTGTIFQKTGRATEVGAEGSMPQGNANLAVADGWAWRRATEFDDVYFAFRVIDRQLTGCAWAEQPPKSNEGLYFVGVSPPAATEDIARDMAMRHARTQVVKYLGEEILATTSSAANLKGYLDNEQVVTTAAEGVASLVKDERYCPAETEKTPDGVMFRVKVLAFFPNTKKQEAAATAVDSLSKQLAADGKLDDTTKRELEAAKAKVGGGVQ